MKKVYFHSEIQLIERTEGLSSHIFLSWEKYAASNKIILLDYSSRTRNQLEEKEREREKEKTSKIDRANKIDVPYVIRELFIPNLLDKSIFLLPAESFLHQVMSLAPYQIWFLHPFIHKHMQRWNT